MLITGDNDQRGTSTDSGATFGFSASSFQEQNGVSAWSADRYVSVGGGGSTRSTQNGGTTFATATAGGGATLRAVVTLPGGLAVAAGNSGTIVRSIDWGATWTTRPSGTAAWLSALTRSPDGVIYAGGTSGTVLRSTDDGLTWSARTSAMAGTVRGMVAPVNSVVWAVGDGGVIARSADGGVTWTAQSSGTASAIVGIDALDGTTAVAAVGTNAAGKGEVLRTTNAGATWTSVFAGQVAYGLYGVKYGDRSTVLTASINGHIDRSTDGGATVRVQGLMQELGVGFEDRCVQDPYERIAELEAENAELREQVRVLLERVDRLEVSSRNSSMPPSSDDPRTRAERRQAARKASKRSIGG